MQVFPYSISSLHRWRPQARRAYGFSPAVALPTFRQRSTRVARARGASFPFRSLIPLIPTALGRGPPHCAGMWHYPSNKPTKRKNKKAKVGKHKKERNLFNEVRVPPF